MNDCPNAEIRDQLPDLLHERLDPAARAEVVTHVESCLGCRAELELLRQLRVTLIQTTPLVDVASIVAALPSPPMVVRRHRTWMDWRIAAAVTVIAIGGGSAVVLSHGGPDARIDSASVAPAVVAQPVLETPPARVATAAPAESATQSRSPATHQTGSASSDAQGLEMTGHLGDLSDAQLQALLGDISKLEAVPMTEPEAVAVPITMKNGSANDEGLE